MVHDFKIEEMPLFVLSSMTGMNIDSEFYGETWKVNSETKCAEISSPSTENCENEVCAPCLRGFHAPTRPC